MIWNPCTTGEMDVLRRKEASQRQGHNVMSSWRRWAQVSVIGWSFAASTAYAQRADENATASAEDAFGTRVGNESVGLYSATSARGFNPQLAGNMRIEGLYYDQQGLFGSRMQRSQTMRVGLSAQSYPFPAPTGIVDISIVKPAETRIVSFAEQLSSPIGGSLTSIDIVTPLIPGTLGFAGGFAVLIGPNDYNGYYKTPGGGGVLRWTPRESLEILPLTYYSTGTVEVQPLILPGGAYLPPRLDRDVFLGQPWATRKVIDRTFGLITRGHVTDAWQAQVGIFDSKNNRPRNHSVLYRNVQANGDALLDIVGSPQHVSASTSGEARLSGTTTRGAFRHTLHLATRGRDTRRTFGGTQTVAFGPTTINAFRAVAKPAFTYDVRDRDVVRQITPGVSYVGQWANVGELSLGLQKSFYRRRFGKENAAPAETRSDPWLPNATVAVYPTKDLALYASYTRGLEEFGTAPDNAVNRGQPVPAALTEQIDGGLRYRIKPGLSVVAGVFEISKPYFDRDQANVYTDVGALRHRGVEMSLTGQVAPGLTVVAGAVLIQARVSGLSVDRGLIGPIPPGIPPAKYLLNVQYTLPSLKGFSVDTQVNVDESHYANRANSFRIPAAVTWDLGTRYSFAAFGTRASLRLQVRNVTNAYDWTVDGASGRIAPTSPRRYVMRLAADY